MDAVFKKPFQGQVDYFREKLTLPSEAWDDIIGASHDRAFMVAGAQSVDLLADLYDAVSQAINEGKGLDWFQKSFDTITRQRGWTDFTGSDSAAGRAWRSQIIYQTNTTTSYAAGRWAQLNDPDLVSVRPFWCYVHSDLVDHPRPQHKAWHGLVLHKDHPFWKTHFPPNGWGCCCTVKAASDGDIAAAQAKGLDVAPEGWELLDDLTGTPSGIDRGWGHAPGANAKTDLRMLFDAKVAALPGPLADVFRAYLDQVQP